MTDQLKAIKRVLLSRIICDAGEGVVTIQPRAMLQHTISQNQRVNCSDIPELDLSTFQEINGSFRSEWGLETDAKTGKKMVRFHW